MRIIVENNCKSDIKTIQSFFENDNDINVSLTNNNFVFDFSQLNVTKYKKNHNVVYNEFLDKIANIKSYGLKNGKRVFNNYNSERKVSNRLKKVEKRLGYKEFFKEFSKTNNTIPAVWLDKVICGDSYKILKQLPDNCIDVVITSPPYNFGIGYNQHDDTKKWSEYFNTLFKIFDECVRVLKFGGRLIVNVQPLYSDYIPTHHVISKHFFDLGLIWKSEILWEKNNYNCKYTAWGSWKSCSNPYMKYTWEYLEVFCKGSLKKEKTLLSSDITDEEFKQFVIAKWSIAPERKMKQYGNPAMFPEKLVERCLKLFSYPGDVILDPFNGAGTTTYVSRKNNRHYLGIDIDKKYCDVAERRLNCEYEKRKK